MPEPLNQKPKHPDVGFETNEEVLFTEPELMAHSLRIADYRIYSGEVEGQNDAWLHVQNEQNINLSQCATLFSYVVKLSLSFRNYDKNTCEYSRHSNKMLHCFFPHRTFPFLDALRCATNAMTLFFALRKNCCHITLPARHCLARPSSSL